MEIEKGSVIIWDKKFWLFAGYGKDEKARQTYRLHGLNGEVVEILAEKCNLLISPSEMRI